MDLLQLYFDYKYLCLVVIDYLLIVFKLYDKRRYDEIIRNRKQLLVTCFHYCNLITIRLYLSQTYFVLMLI
jgi:hypothetical protein